jgi:hypothetical protein
MIDDDDCGTVGGMRIGRGNRSTRIKPAPVPLCPPQIEHDLIWTRTRAAAVGGRPGVSLALLCRPYTVLSCVVLDCGCSHAERHEEVRGAEA